MNDVEQSKLLALLGRDIGVNFPLCDYGPHQWPRSGFSVDNFVRNVAVERGQLTYFPVFFLIHFFAKAFLSMKSKSWHIDSAWFAASALFLEVGAIVWTGATQMSEHGLD